MTAMGHRPNPIQARLSHGVPRYVGDLRWSDDGDCAELVCTDGQVVKLYNHDVDGFRAYVAEQGGPDWSVSENLLKRTLSWRQANPDPYGPDGFPLPSGRRVISVTIDRPPSPCMVSVLEDPPPPRPPGQKGRGLP
jgi:hypothetical protein